MIYEGQPVSGTTFQVRRDGEFVTESTDQYFTGRRVVVFALPGAFTPTCSTYQLPGFEESYDEILSLGIDEVYCVSVNDSFVMNAWFKDLGIEKVKAIPDGNAAFTEIMGTKVLKTNLGFGYRSWRYAVVLNNNTVEKLFVEPGLSNNVSDDPYGASSPESVLEYLKAVFQPAEVVVEEIVTDENTIVEEVGE